MADRKRLSICYIAPGHYLLPSAGPTRNILSLAEALSQQAEVTVAFRSVLEPIRDSAYDVVAIASERRHAKKPLDDAGIRGMGLREFIAYLASLKRFIAERVHGYDVVLEKSWLLSGYVVALCRRWGVPGTVVENVVRVWHQPMRNGRDVVRYTYHQISQALVGRYLRRTPLIIAETPELQAAIRERWRLPTDRIAVVGLGVDHRLFRPLDQRQARRELGIPPEIRVLLYAGICDQTHDLTPAVEATCEVSNTHVALHVVGDGVLQEFYKDKARVAKGNVVFHGRVPHATVPQYIAAADLCLAPYDVTTFRNGQVAYATLKVPEYMACARPVVSVPSGHMQTLIQHGISGFLFDNDREHWRQFLRHCPSREVLQTMGRAAARQVSAYTWESTAHAYLALCEQLISTNDKTYGMIANKRRDSIAGDTQVGH